jgi:hypothetical protein
VILLYAGKLPAAEGLLPDHLRLLKKTDIAALYRIKP